MSERLLEGVPAGRITIGDILGNWVVVGFTTRNGVTLVRIQKREAE